jgi:hypothetical protein
MRTAAIATTLFLAACGTPEDGVNGSSCSVEQRDDGAYLACTDGTAARVLHGQDGSDSSQGSLVAEVYSCVGILDETPMLYTYRVVVLATGDVLATFSVAGGRLESSNSVLHAAGTQGAETGWVMMVRDEYGADSYGIWEASSSRGADTISVVVTYDDDDLAEDMAWSIPANDCTHNAYQEQQR